MTDRRWVELHIAANKWVDAIATHIVCTKARRIIKGSAIRIGCSTVAGPSIAIKIIGISNARELPTQMHDNLLVTI